MTVQTQIDRMLESRPTMAFTILAGMMKHSGMKIVDIRGQSDGFSALGRDQSGQAYEVTIRPAAYAKHSSFREYFGAGKGTARVGGFPKRGERRPILP